MSFRCTRLFQARMIPNKLINSPFQQTRFVTINAEYDDPDMVYKSVQNYYGKVLGSSKDLLTNACTTSAKPNDLVVDIIKKIPQPIIDKYYGCGTPLPMGIEGSDVLDLGSGSGRDCYLAAALVGEKGSVIGIDMTDEQLEVAGNHVDEYCIDTLGYPKSNLSFKKGYIEFLEDAGIEKNSLDIVISNCVINLSPDKPRVIQGVYDALREGGEFYFSDVYCNRRLSKEIQEHDILLGECLGGALYIEDFKRICQQVGFMDPRVLKTDPIIVHDPELQELLGEAKFYSITYRCFKAEGMETLCEEYGQTAVYNGTIPEHKNSYWLDDHHFFETGLPMRVCGNTASMVSDTWLGSHFTVTGDRSKHYGLFDCSTPVALASSGEADPSDAGCC